MLCCWRREGRCVVCSVGSRSVAALKVSHSCRWSPAFTRRMSREEHSHGGRGQACQMKFSQFFLKSTCPPPPPSALFKSHSHSLSLSLRRRTRHKALAPCRTRRGSGSLPWVRHTSRGSGLPLGPGCPVINYVMAGTGRLSRAVMLRQWTPGDMGRVSRPADSCSDVPTHRQWTPRTWALSLAPTRRCGWIGMSGAG